MDFKHMDHKFFLWLLPLLLILSYSCSRSEHTPGNDIGNPPDAETRSGISVTVFAGSTYNGNPGNMDFNITDFRIYIFNSSTGLLETMFGMDSNGTDVGPVSSLLPAADGSVTISTEEALSGRKDMVVLANLEIFGTSGSQGGTDRPEWLTYPEVTLGVTPISDFKAAVCTIPEGVSTLFPDDAATVPMSSIRQVTLQPDTENILEISLERLISRVSLALGENLNDMSPYGYIEKTPSYKALSVANEFYLLPRTGTDGIWTTPLYSLPDHTGKYSDAPDYNDSQPYRTYTSYVTENRVAVNTPENTTGLLVKAAFRPIVLYDGNGQNPWRWDESSRSYFDLDGNRHSLPDESVDGQTYRTYWRLWRKDASEASVNYYYENPALKDDPFFDTVLWESVPYRNFECWYRIFLEDQSQTPATSVQRNRWFDVKITSCSGAGYPTEDGAIDSPSVPDPDSNIEIGITFKVRDWEDNDIPVEL